MGLLTGLLGAALDTVLLPVAVVGEVLTGPDGEPLTERQIERIARRLEDATDGDLL